jgi:serine/threonine-protein kinase RsbW
MRQEAWLPAAPESAMRARGLVRDFADRLGLDGSTTWELTLATTEAFANAVEHGRPCDPRGIHVTLENRDGRVAVEVCDCGGCFPSERPASTKKLNGEGGRGISIIEAIMDHLEVVPDTGRTYVRFGKRLAAA